jgi:succinate dehydrogenase/fumarate reductase flavoprotein subunit
MEGSAPVHVDVIVIGSGGSGMSAACTAAVGGAEVLVLERTDGLGGTTTYSGGALWIPNNRLMADAGMQDSRDDALTYLRTLTKGFVAEPLLATFVDHANPMVEFFEEHAAFEMSCRYDQADYQPTFPGARSGGRCIENERIVFAHELGEIGAAMRNSYAAIQSPFHANLHTSSELNHMQRTGIDIDPEVARQRAEQGALMRGRGLVASLLHAGQKLGVTPLLSTSAVKLLVERDRVVGVEVEHDGRREQHRARRGVVLATGGFEWNRELVRSFLGVPELTPASPPTGRGLGLGLALAVGAAIGNMTSAWWDVVMHEPGQIYDGEPYYQTTTLWRGRAGTMMVNRDGRRFVNESMNYSDMGLVMKAFDPLSYEYPNLPNHIIIDRGMRESFRIGSINPGGDDPDWLLRSDTIGELADVAGIDRAGLTAQLEEFNRNAAKGVDPEFHRGEDPYDRYRGDPSAPHPNLRPLEAPFYAIPQTLGCLGTKGGPVINEHAQVLDFHGRPIPGLYATGNVVANVFGFSYPGPGATLGSGLTFGYLAGRHLTRADR